MGLLLVHVPVCENRPAIRSKDGLQMTHGYIMYIFMSIILLVQLFTHVKGHGPSDRAGTCTQCSASSTPCSTMQDINTTSYKTAKDSSMLNVTCLNETHSSHINIIQGYFIKTCESGPPEYRGENYMYMNVLNDTFYMELNQTCDAQPECNIRIVPACVKIPRCTPGHGEDTDAAMVMYTCVPDPTISTQTVSTSTGSTQDLTHVSGTTSYRSSVTESSHTTLTSSQGTDRIATSTHGPTHTTYTQTTSPLDGATSPNSYTGHYTEITVTTDVDASAASSQKAIHIAVPIVVVVVSVVVLVVVLVHKKRHKATPPDEPHNKAPISSAFGNAVYNNKDDIIGGISMATQPTLPVDTTTRHTPTSPSTNIYESGESDNHKYYEVTMAAQDTSNHGNMPAFSLTQDPTYSLATDPGYSLATQPGAMVTPQSGGVHYDTPLPVDAVKQGPPSQYRYSQVNKPRSGENPDDLVIQENVKYESSGGRSNHGNQSADTVLVDNTQYAPWSDEHKPKPVSDLDGTVLTDNTQYAPWGEDIISTDPTTQSPTKDTDSTVIMDNTQYAPWGDPQSVKPPQNVTAQSNVATDDTILLDNTEYAPWGDNPTHSK